MEFYVKYSEFMGGMQMSLSIAYGFTNYLVGATWINDGLPILLIMLARISWERFPSEG